MGKHEVLQVLKKKKGNYVSSREVADTLNIAQETASRCLMALVREGDIELKKFSRNNWGYIYLEINNQDKIEI